MFPGSGSLLHFRSSLGVGHPVVSFSCASFSHRAWSPVSLSFFVFCALFSFPSSFDGHQPPICHLPRTGHPLVWPDTLGQQVFPMGGSQPHSPSLQSGVGRPVVALFLHLLFSPGLVTPAFPLFLFCSAAFLSRRFRLLFCLACCAAPMMTLSRVAGGGPGQPSQEHTVFEVLGHDL